jgi:hypothetical protein
MYPRPCIAGHVSQATYRRPRIAGHVSQATYRRPRIAGHVSQAMHRSPCIAGHASRANGRVRQFAACLAMACAGPAGTAATHWAHDHVPQRVRTRLKLRAQARPGVSGRKIRQDVVVRKGAAAPVLVERRSMGERLLMRRGPAWWSARQISVGLKKRRVFATRGCLSGAGRGGKDPTFSGNHPFSSAIVSK